AAAIASRARLLRNAGLSVQSGQAGCGDQAAVPLAPRTISRRRAAPGAKAPANSRHRAGLVRNGGLGRWRDIRVDRDAAQQVESRAERLVVLLRGRNVGLRARLLRAFGGQMTAHRRLSL